MAVQCGFDMTNNQVIDSFRNEFGFLSNFYESSLYIDGQKFKSVEHAFQAYKTLDESARELIREANTPAQAKKLGRAVLLREDWEQIKYDLMLKFVRAKFNNPILKCMLLATAPAILIEGNNWNDTVWGVCRGQGQNLLGKILMQVRDEIAMNEQDLVQLTKVKI